MEAWQHGKLIVFEGEARGVPTRIWKQQHSPAGIPTVYWAEQKLSAPWWPVNDWRLVHSRLELNILIQQLAADDMHTKDALVKHFHDETVAPRQQAAGAASPSAAEAGGPVLRAPAAASSSAAAAAGGGGSAVLAVGAGPGGDGSLMAEQQGGSPAKRARGNSGAAYGPEGSLPAALGGPFGYTGLAAGRPGSLNNPPAGMSGQSTGAPLFLPHLQGLTAVNWRGGGGSDSWAGGRMPPSSTYLGGSRQQQFQPGIFYSPQQPMRINFLDMQQPESAAGLAAAIAGAAAAAGVTAANAVIAAAAGSPAAGGAQGAGVGMGSPASAINFQGLRLGNMQGIPAYRSVGMPALQPAAQHHPHPGPQHPPQQQPPRQQQPQPGGLPPGGMMLMPGQGGSGQLQVAAGPAPDGAVKPRPLAPLVPGSVGPHQHKVPAAFQQQRPAPPPAAAGPAPAPAMAQDPLRQHPQHGPQQPPAPGAGGAPLGQEDVPAGLNLAGLEEIDPFALLGDDPFALLGDLQSEELLLDDELQQLLADSFDKEV